MERTVLLPQHHRPLDSKVQQKNMLLMLLSLPVRAMVGGRMASFSPAAYTRAIYHFDRPFTSAKCFTISLLLVTHCEHHVTCRNITALLNSANALRRHREIMWRTCPVPRQRVRVRAYTQSSGVLLNPWENLQKSSRSKTETHLSPAHHFRLTLWQHWKLTQANKHLSGV